MDSQALTPNILKQLAVFAKRIGNPKPAEWIAALMDDTVLADDIEAMIVNHFEGSVTKFVLSVAIYLNTNNMLPEIEEPESEEESLDSIAMMEDRDWT